jgi:predicted DNA-binding transcriptional regulator AlpA
MSKKFLRPKQVRARYGNIGHSTLYRWVHEGRIPAPVKIVPGAKASGWLEEELDAADAANLASQRTVVAAA